MVINEAHQRTNTETEQLFPSDEILGLVSTFVPHLFLNHTLRAEITTPTQKTIDLLLTIQPDGSYLFRNEYGDEEAIYQNGQKISDTGLVLPEDLKFDSILWVEYEDRSYRNEPGVFKDSIIAGAFNYYYQRMHAWSLKEESKDRAVEYMAREVDREILTGDVWGLQIAPISTAVAKQLEGPYFSLALCLNYQGLYDQKYPGQAILMTGENGEVFDAAIFDSEYERDADGKRLYGLYPAQGVLFEMVIAAIMGDQYISPDGIRVMQDIVHSDKFGDSTLLYYFDKNNQKIDLASGTPEQLRERGFHAITHRISARDFAAIYNDLQEQKRTVAQQALLEGIHVFDPLFTTSTQQLQGLPAISTLRTPEGQLVPTAEPGKVQILGTQIVEALTHEGGPSGYGASRLAIGIDKRVFVLESAVENGNVFARPLQGCPSLSTQERLNIACALDNPKLVDVSQPFVSVINWRSEGGAKDIVYFASIPTSIGCEAIGFHPQVPTLRDYEIHIPDNSSDIYTADELALVPTNSQRSIRPKEQMLGLVFAKGPGVLMPAYYEKTEYDDQLMEIITAADKMVPLGSHGFTGMTQIDFETFMRLHNIAYEQGQMLAGINGIQSAITSCRSVFGIKSEQDQNTTLRDYIKNHLKIFGKDGYPKYELRQTTQPSLWISYLEQRDAVENFATYLTRFRMHINSDDLRIPQMHVYFNREGIVDIYDGATGKEAKNYFISLHNVTRLLLKKNHRVDINHIMQSVVIHKPLDNRLVRGDVIFSDTGELNQILGEKIIRRKLIEKEYVYFQGEVQNEKELDTLAVSDIELELMFRYIRGEINITRSGDNTFTFTEIPAAEVKVRSLTYDRLVAVRKELNIAAAEEALRRQFARAAEIIQSHGVSNGNLSAQLKNAYELLSLPQKAETPLQTIRSITIDNGVMHIEFVFDDFLAVGVSYTEQFEINLAKRTLELSRKSSKKGAPDSFEVEENEFIHTLTAGLFENSKLHLTRLEVIEIYEKFNNLDGAIWVHDLAGRLAVRSGNTIFIFDEKDPIHITEIKNAEKYAFAAEVPQKPVKALSHLIRRDATIAERRLFAQEILSYPRTFSMLFAYEDATATVNKLVELKAAEVAVKKEFDTAYQASKLRRNGIFPSPDIYKNHISSDIMLRLIISLTLDEPVDSDILIRNAYSEESDTKDNIYKQIKSFDNRTFIVHTNLSILKNLGILHEFSNLWKRINGVEVTELDITESTLQYIVRVGDKNDPNCYFVVGIDPRSPRFKGIPTNHKVPAGEVLAIRVHNNEHKLVTVASPYILQSDGTYAPSNYPNPFIDFMGREGKKGHRTYPDEVRLILTLDAIGILANATTDRDRAIILAELLELDTDDVGLGEVPKVFESLWGIYMAPFPKPGQPTPIVASI